MYKAHDILTFILV